MAAPAASVSIKRIVSVSTSDSQVGWNIDSVTCVDGIEFVALAKSNYGFTKWVCENGFTRKEFNQMHFLSELARRRTDATINACSAEVSSDLFDDIAQAKPSAKKAKTIVQRQVAAGALPTMVQLQLPTFETSGGEIVPETDVRVISSIDIRSAVFIELSAPALLYVREAMRKSTRPSIDRQARCSDGVAWRADRKAWKAARTEFGTRDVKHFKVSNVDCVVDMESVRRAAKRWVDYGDDIGNENEPLADADCAGDALPVVQDAEMGAADEVPIIAAHGDIEANGDACPITE